MSNVITVRAIQEKLLARGYELPKWGADGRGGVETVEALRAFQSVTWGLVPTGNLQGENGQKTLRALFLVSPSWTPSWIEKIIVDYVDKQLRRTPMWQILQGKKTYIVTGVAALVIIANHFFGPIPNVGLDPNQWLTQLGALVFPVTIRAAIPDKNKIENGGTK